MAQITNIGRNSKEANLWIDSIHCLSVQVHQRPHRICQNVTLQSVPPDSTTEINNNICIKTIFLAQVLKKCCPGKLKKCCSDYRTETVRQNNTESQEIDDTMALSQKPVLFSSLRPRKRFRLGTGMLLNTK